MKPIRIFIRSAHKENRMRCTLDKGNQDDARDAAIGAFCPPFPLRPHRRLNPRRSKPDSCLDALNHFQREPHAIYDKGGRHG